MMFILSIFFISEKKNSERRKENRKQKVSEGIFGLCVVVCLGKVSVVGCELEKA